MRRLFASHELRKSPRHARFLYGKNELDLAGVELDVVGVQPVIVACVEHRLESALAQTFASCALGFGDRGGTLHVDVEVDDTRVRIGLDASPDNASIPRIRDLIVPLGGALDVENGSATLWLPRA